MGGERGEAMREAGEEAGSVMGKSESEAGARPQEARRRVARAVGEAGAAEGGELRGMRWGAGQAPSCGGGSGGKWLLWRTEVRGETWKRMTRAGAVVRMRAEGGAWEWAAPQAFP